MATIITVHGTYATGGETGDKWWQRGSSFESELRELVQGADGRLDFAPFGWDGLNSETARREAGAELAQRLLDLEKRRERCCVIGHSHGGSVILAALTQCIYRRRPLPNLSRWITIGTPFVTFARKTLLFSRLGVFGKAAWVSLLTFCCLLSVGVVLNNSKTQEHDVAASVSAVAVIGVIFLMIHAIVGWNIDRKLARAGRNISGEAAGRWPLPQMGLARRIYYVAMLFVLIAVVVDRLKENPSDVPVIVPILIMLLLLLLPPILLWLRQRVPDMRRWVGLGRAHRSQLATRTFTSWLAFRHPQDEAVEGLQRVSGVSFPIFDKNFATGPLTFLAVMLLPLLTVAALFTPAFMRWFVHVLAPAGFNVSGMIENDQLIGNGHDIIANLIAIFVLPIVALLGRATDDRLVLVVLIGAPIMFLLGAIFVVAVTRVIASGISRVLSVLLNQAAWQQIRASAYGNDTRGEVSLTATGAPELVALQPALPAALAAEISAVADAAAAGTLSKFRTSLNRLAFAGEGGSGGQPDLVADYLTWDELVHTAYFKVPLFNKYLAYAIANSEGFRPTARFLADPDYARLAQWYADHTAQAVQAAARNMAGTAAARPAAQRPAA